MGYIESVISVIERYYPLLEGFDESKVPNNKYLPELSAVCDIAKFSLTTWNERLERLAALIPESQIIDDSLLEANEPSYMVSVVNHSKKLRLICYVSILTPCFFSFIQSEKNEDAFILNELVIKWLWDEFPSYQYLTMQECSMPIKWIKVPSIYDDTVVPTIADCIFGTRSLKGH